MAKKKIAGKIGYSNNRDLPGLRKLKGGHYVYIRSYDKNTGLCEVNTITSLEDGKRSIKEKRIMQVKKSNIYAIPNFTKWSGVTKKPIKNVAIKSIKNIGKKDIKNRHKFFIGKYLK